MKIIYIFTICRRFAIIISLCMYFLLGNLSAIYYLKKIRSQSIHLNPSVRDFSLPSNEIPTYLNCIITAVNG